MVGNKTPNSRKEIIKRLTGFPQKSSPLQYLGCPIFIGRKSKYLFNGFVDSIKLRINSWSKNCLSSGGRITLIRSVLSSIPVHLISVLQPPKGTLHDIEMILANFLWGERQGTAKFHWRKWENLCFPTSEGGIGIRSLQDLCEAYSIKFWWKFREKNSLWADFLHAKYIGHSHPSLARKLKNSSHVWRRMVECRELAETYITWEINEGNISSLWDNWLGEKALGLSAMTYDCPIKNFISNDRWNLEKIVDWMPNFPISLLNPRLLDPQPHKPDSMIWKLSSTGEFTLKSAYHLVRSKNSSSLADEKIWHVVLPQKISFFMGNLWRFRIPTDDIISKLQINGPSICDCCFADLEYIEHLFSRGPRAEFIWNFFENSLGIFCAPRPFWTRCSFWWNAKSNNPLLQLVYQIIPSFISWFI